MSEGITTAAPAPRRNLAVFTLSAFAIAQPLLSVLLERDVFLHDLQPGWPELIGLVIVLLVLIPAAIRLVDACVIRIAKRSLARCRDAVFLILFVLIGLSFSRALVDGPLLREFGISWLVSSVLSVSFAVMLTRLWNRSSTFRHLLAVTSICLLLFPAHFLWQMSVVIRSQQPDPVTSVNPAGTPVPVVLIVFDEFCGLSLMNEDREIDAVRFPNFARLAAASTWFRNATANHGQTERALPAILTGRLPDPEALKPPTAETVNLFQLVRQTGQYEMAVFEPYSRLCSDELKPRRKPLADSAAGQLRELCRTLIRVYPWLLLAKDTPVMLPVIPHAWFGLAHPMDESRSERRGLHRYFWNSERPDQLNHFLRCLYPGERPGFHFIHVALPHFPWCHFPDGNYYIPESFSDQRALGTTEEVWVEDAAICHEAETRYLLQLGYLDQFAGKLLDQLQQQGLYDQCLLIVTADHGVSFAPGHSRRKPDRETLPDIVSIPLFVKLPHQQAGIQSDRNVESIDLLPTITDLVDLPLSDPLDGTSLMDESVAEKPRKTFIYGREMTVLESRFPQMESRLKRHCELFLPGQPWEVLWDRLSPGPRGRSLTEYRIVDSAYETGLRWIGPERRRSGPRAEPPENRENKPAPRSAQLESGLYVTSLVEGRVPRGFPDDAQIAVVVNGTIRGVSRPIRKGVDQRWWSVLLTEADGRQLGGKPPELYMIRDSEAGRLERLKVRIDNETLSY